MRKAEEGCRPRLGVAVQAEVAAALHASAAARDNLEESQVTRGNSKANQ